MSKANITSRVVLSDDGVYRWAYSLPMNRNYSIFWTTLKVFYGCMLLPVAMCLIKEIADGEAFLEIVKDLYPFIYVYMFITVLTFVSYKIVAIINGGTYNILYEMNEDGIAYLEAPEQKETSDAISTVALISGLASKNMSQTGLAMSNLGTQKYYTEFAKVFRIKEVRRNNLIKVSAPLSYNQIYMMEEDYDFVLDYIKNHCPKAVVKKGHF